jgi:hypothetical protein
VTLSRPLDPTLPGYQAALQPFWGQNRPFALASGADTDPGPPPSFATAPGSQFYAEAREVYEAVETLTEEQRAIALFWSDDPGHTATPPGRSLSILTQVLEERGADLAVAAEAYAKAGMAVADAFIGCWHSKYRYHLMRPISYIQQHIDAGWGAGERALPVVTPPFPEYTSGTRCRQRPSLRCCSASSVTSPSAITRTLRADWRRVPSTPASRWRGDGYFTAVRRHSLPVRR